MSTVVSRPPAVRSWRRVSDAARPQLTVMAGQMVAGLGNLLFAVLVARLLVDDPGGYADVTAFLALFLLLHLPAAALSAAGALSPTELAERRSTVTIVGVVAGIVLAAASPWLAPLTGLPIVLVFALAVTAPAAGLLGLERGLAYGHDRHRHLVHSLVAEPAVRLVAGAGLAAAFGAVGAAVGVVAGGYIALWCVASTRPAAAIDPLTDTTIARSDETAQGPRDASAESARRGGAVGVAAGFVLVAVIQAQDLLVANHRLDPDAAGGFGVLSTLGGAAVFATATIPLVLLPAAAKRRPGATSTAVVLTVAVGLAVAVGGTLLATPLVEAFGSRYADVAGLVGPYLFAMALIGVARVLVARRCAAGEHRFALAVVGAVAVGDLALLLALGDRPGAIVGVTVAGASALVIGLAAPDVVPLPVMRERSVEWARSLDRERVLGLAALSAVALVVRLLSTRGLWVDEAISVRQARLPFGEMLAQLRESDVHPPLHHAVLWVTVRVFGTSELAVRLPSVLAGVALIPVMYMTGRALYDRRTGWIAAALAVFAPFCVWYSQEARMYSMFMLFATVAVYGQVMAIRRGATRDWVVYALATAAMCWTQYFALLPVAVQQVAFAAVAWRRWRAHDRDGLAALAKGWAGSTFVIAIVMLPLVGIVRDQLESYGNRGAGLVPSQAGSGSSNVGGVISIYAVVANVIWAIWGYHADATMVRLAALWPAAMLAGLLLLGRGRSGRTMLLLALAVVPLLALFVVGSRKRDLFELRYFSGAVPIGLLMLARFASVTTRRRVTATVAGALVVATMAVGLADQQLNGANPRRYDFEGALERVTSNAEPGDVLLYEPVYLEDVIDYYAPELEIMPIGDYEQVATTDATVYVLATERVLNAEETSANVGFVLAELEQDRRIVDRFERPNVEVWELR